MGHDGMHPQLLNDLSHTIARSLLDNLEQVVGFNILLSDTDDSRECTCNEFADNIKLGRMINRSDDCTTIEWPFERLKKNGLRSHEQRRMSSPAKNFPFNKGKLKVLHLGKKTPMHHFRPYSRESCWKAALQKKKNILKVLVHTKLTMHQQHALAARKAKSTVGSIQQSITSRMKKWKRWPLLSDCSGVL